MNMTSMTAVLLGLATVSACGSRAEMSTGSGGAVGGNGESGGTAGAAGTTVTAVGDGGQSGPGLAMLSLTEAPAATRSFFWGTIDVSAPGFVGPPRDEMTIGLGPDNSLRSMSWKTLPALPKTYGEGGGDFPLSGSRRVDLRPDITLDYTATVLDSAQTASHFSLREHIVSVEGQCDYVESVEGTWTGGGWSVVYSDEGKLYGAAIAAHASGTLYPGDPKAPAPVVGQASLWYAPVELVAPGFYGPPIDHLAVSLDGTGQIRWFAFNNFVRGISFTGNSDELQPGKLAIADEGDVAFDSVVPATPTHFVVRYTVHSEEKANDYTEGLDGTRQGDTLMIRYFISGKLWGATIAAHAAGMLVPARASAPVAAGAGGSGGGGMGNGMAGGSGVGGSGAGGAGGLITLP